MVGGLQENPSTTVVISPLSVRYRARPAPRADGQALKGLRVVTKLSLLRDCHHIYYQRATP